MPFPAYRGKQFYFDIPIGLLWNHEFDVTNRNTGEPMLWEPDGWTALCVIRSNEGQRLATLDTEGTADGLITLAPGLILLELPSAFTAELPPTTTFGGRQPKAFAWADLTLTDPMNGEPYIAARGKGTTYSPTTIGAYP